MILAAGRGERLRPLTDTLPKPLIEVGGETLIERHVRALVAARRREIVINLSYLGHLIEERLGDGARYGAEIVYSRESDGPLETAGGIVQALPWLGAEPFVVVNGDIWTDFPLATLARPRGVAHIVLVDNPAHHPRGDFGLSGRLATRGGSQPYTYSGIACFDPGWFAAMAAAVAPLGPLLFDLAAEGALGAELWRGRWFDIGTPERLEQARSAVAADRAAPRDSPPLSA